MAESPSNRPRVRAIVHDFLTENFTLGAAPEIDDTVSLVESGILDSTGVTELVAFLEQTFSITIPEAEMTGENLDSIERIADFVTTLMSPQPTHSYNAATVMPD